MKELTLIISNCYECPHSIKLSSGLFCNYGDNDNEIISPLNLIQNGIIIEHPDVCIPDFCPLRDSA